MLIRYPGSKDRQAQRILAVLQIADRRLCEPFAGTAAITFACLRAGLLDQAWLNDTDCGVSGLWTTVRDYPDELCTRIAAYEPTAGSFYELRDKELDGPLDNAFATIVLHQISYSGLGRKAGSPIGGRNQQGKYKVGCRWNADRLVSGIREAHGLMSKAHVTVTNLDWSDCPDWTWYADPPYAVAGPSLYREGVSPVTALHDHLRTKGEWWVLSYDNVPEIRDLYECWAHVDHGGATYLGSTYHTKRHKSELLITPTAPRDGVLFAVHPLSAKLGDGKP
jgi:DNA adenine methylase